MKIHSKIENVAKSCQNVEHVSRCIQKSSMYQKALLKKRYYAGKIGAKELLYKVIFWVLKRAPFTQNKMVVIARKAS